MITLYNPMHKITRSYELSYYKAIQAFKDDMYMHGYTHWKCVEVLSYN